MNSLKMFSFPNLNKFGLLFGLNFNTSKAVLEQLNLTKKLFSSLTQNRKIPYIGTNINLVPHNPVVVPSCGFKVKGRLRRRCKDCYLARKDGRMYVFCSSYPRHKQMAMVKREKYTWILSHCCQSKQRPY